MRFHHAGVAVVALAALAGCGGYTASGPYGGGGGMGTGTGGSGGGPVGSVSVGNGATSCSRAATMVRHTPQWIPLRRAAP
jgi:hypothetical protein